MLSTFATNTDGFFKHLMSFSWRDYVSTKLDQFTEGEWFLIYVVSSCLCLASGLNDVSVGVPPTADT